MIAFQVDGRLSKFKKKSHQNFFIKKILSLVFYKTDFGVLKFKSPILKPKLNFQHSFHQHNIKVALHKYVGKN
jgi:hypothetical protein